MGVSVETPVSDAVSDAAGCARCGYSLRGIPDEQPCPECGLLARQSRVASDDIVNHSPTWLRGIVVGLALITTAHLIVFTWWKINRLIYDHYINEWMELYRQAGNVPVAYVPKFLGIPLNFDYIESIGLDAAAVCLAVGVFLASRPRRGSSGQDRLARFAMRVSSLCPLMTMIILHAWLIFAGYVPRIGLNAIHATWENWLVLLLMTWGCAPLSFLLYRYLRQLARQVLNRSLVEHATIAGVGVAAVLAIFPVIYWLLLRSARAGGGFGSDQSGLRTMVLLCLFTAFILFGLWSTWASACFLRAFWRAYRAATGRWVLADRGNGVG